MNGAITSFRQAVRLAPRYALAHDNLGLALACNGDLDGAVTAYREAARLGQKDPALQARLRRVERWRELTPRLADAAAGRDGLASPAEGCELAELAAQPFQRRYLLAVRLYQQAFAADPKLAAGHRYNAACAAALAAAGRDAGSPPPGMDEWGYLTGLAHGCLRADLAALAARTGDSKGRPGVRQALAHWKQDPDLLSFRDGAWVHAMPPADRERWRALWADVDALLAKVGQSEATGK